MGAVGGENENKEGEKEEFPSRQVSRRIDKRIDRRIVADIDRVTEPSTEMRTKIILLLFAVSIKP